MSVSERKGRPRKPPAPLSREWARQDGRSERPSRMSANGSRSDVKPAATRSIRIIAGHAQLGQQSKQEAIQALSTGFAEQMNRVKTELTTKDATVSSISRYFERLVAELTDKSQRDPKTKLMNFGRFTEQLEAFLALEQRGRWCAIGLVDITGFKWYNDALGHAIGDRIIERVAHLLREQVRSDDLIAQERLDAHSQDLHARFGGDEFCFLIPDL